MIELLIYFFIACALITAIGLCLTLFALPFAMLAGLFSRLLPKKPTQPE